MPVLTLIPIDALGETPADHVANACQLLLCAELILENPDRIEDGGEELRLALTAAQARLLKALFLMRADARVVVRPS